MTLSAWKLFQISRLVICHQMATQFEQHAGRVFTVYVLVVLALVLLDFRVQHARKLVNCQAICSLTFPDSFVLQVTLDATLEIDLAPEEVVTYWFDWVGDEEADLLVDASDLSIDLDVYVSKLPPTTLNYLSQR